ncbi:MAG: glycosyltransferase [Clostridia bacterium]|nr:glycosyltransferase [Clostridia bacterium]
MKKKLLIVSHALELGGAERSLIGLLDALNPEFWDIDLFLLRHEGELLHAVPVYVNLLPVVPAYTVLARPMKDTLREGHLLLTAARLAGKLAAKRYDKQHGLTESGVSLEYSHKYTCKFMPKIQPETEYDLAVSFLTPHYFVANKVRAKKKIAWIHTDYSKVQVNIPSETAMWGAYDYSASISQAVTDGFLSVFPSLKNKIVLIENILPESLIRRQAKEPCADMHRAGGEKILLSVGRFSHAKNFDNVPDMCARLLRYGLDVRWYLIGYGGDEALIRQKIKEAGMEERVIILGKKSNPYPYVAACDLYVQPSRYEGKCVTVREAQMLGKPVVITRYATSASQLEEGVDGEIVPMDNEGCAAGIAALLRNPEKMQQFSANCRRRDYSNSEEAEKLSRLME